MFNPNATLTDSMERELIAQELDYFNDTPLLSFFRWIGAGLKNVQNKLVSFVGSATADLSGAHK